VDPDHCEALAAACLAEFGTLGRTWSQSPEALARVVGYDNGVAELIAAAGTAMAAGLQAGVATEPVDPFSASLRSYLIQSIGSLPDEVFRVLFLDSTHRLLAEEQLQRGTLSELAVYPRTIFRRALELNASALILVHNHPSGDSRPSDADLLATQRLEAVGLPLGIDILDHIIVTASYVHHIVKSRRPRLRHRLHAGFTLRSPDHKRGLKADVACDRARRTIRRRLLRRQLMGAQELFGEPAWEILLDVFVHECEGKPLAITSTCATAGIPMSSGLRLIQKLCEAGLLRRFPDPFDGRRCFVRLQPAALDRMRAYFSLAVEEPDNATRGDIYRNL
jgi:DNA repair protein RadC